MESQLRSWIASEGIENVATILDMVLEDEGYRLLLYKGEELIYPSDQP